MFHVMVDNAVAMAAPFMPNVGIRSIFNKMFRIVEMATMFLNIFWFPVRSRKYPTEPARQFTTWPDVSINRVVEPLLKSLPKSDKTSVGKNRNTVMHGRVE